MAGSTVVSPKIELPSTPVQELIKLSGNQVPERYISHPEASSQDVTNGPSLPYMESPIIDLQLLLDSSSPHGIEELQKLRSTLNSWGCFQVVNHGLASTLLDQLRTVCKEFYALPFEGRQKCARTVDWFEGYGEDITAEDKPINWNDRLHLQIYPVEQRNLKLWPENVPNFRETLHEYSIEIRRVLELMLKSMARSLNLEENIFYSHFGEDGMLFARFNYYPPCPSPERVCGLKPHSDGSLISLVLQDKEVEGLQVLKDHQWYKVSIVPYALFINIGDQLEIMSNGMLKSPIHKVVIDKERQRISVAVPIAVRVDKEVGPLDELMSKDAPRQYKNVKDYFSTFIQYAARGERAINAMKIEE